MRFKELFKNIRFYILLFSSILAGAIYFYIKQNIEGNEAQIIKLTQTYALTAVTYLYLALLASPATRFFTFLPWRSQYIFSRRALGVSAFIFASLHAYFAFFGELGGFAGLPFLNSRYLIAITLSATSLVILTFMALTSFEWAINKLTYPKWKLLHKMVYLAALLITIHALMLGSHFTDFSGVIPQIFSLALALLLILEAIRLDNYLSNKFISLPRIGITFFIVLVVVLVTATLALLPTNFTSSLSLHEVHKQLAAEAQKDAATSNAFKNIPGLQGDKTKRYSVDTDFPGEIKPGVPTVLKFKVFDATSGAPVSLFSRNYEKLMHLIIVDNDLNNFQHIHPDFKNGWFEIAATFPRDGRYHLYIDFLPTGAIEQQFGFPLDVGEPGNSDTSKVSVPENSTYKAGDYILTLSFNKPLKASDLSVGAQNLNFKITDLQGNPITNLRSYLGAFGHLVMINTQTFDYLHVHPYQIGNLTPDQSGGPEVVFMPLGLYGPIKPGTYKIFAQFNPNNNLIVSEFIVKVQ
jgi:DMSO/TMAO reductase YedYZ heme-binding membrane subunit